MIKIRTDKEIENDIVQLYYNDELIGEIESSLSFHDILSQIKRDGIDGYYIIFNGEKSNINKYGRVFFNGQRPFNALGDIIRDLI
jgi:hypothetical protein